MSSTLAVVVDLVRGLFLVDGPASLLPAGCVYKRINVYVKRQYSPIAMKLKV